METMPCPALLRVAGRINGHGFDPFSPLPALLGKLVRPRRTYISGQGQLVSQKAKHQGMEWTFAGREKGGGSSRASAQKTSA